MRKVLSWTLCSLMAVLLLSSADAGAQPGAGKRAIRGMGVVQGIGRAAKPGHAIRLDKLPAGRVPSLGRAAASAGAGRNLRVEQARRNSPQGGMLNRNGIRLPQGVGRVPAGELGRYLNDGNLPQSQRYLGSGNLGELSQYLYGNRGAPGYGGYGYNNNYYRRQKGMADAYRDATIANAIVNVVGILATTAAQDQYRSRPVAAAPVVMQQGSPAYEMQKVVVQEGFYQQEQVSVPERQDPATGSVIEAHQEIHRRWVPPVYELRQVQVR